MNYRILSLFLIGMAEAIPLPLTGSILTIRLIEEGIDKAAIAWFLLLHIPYTLKILWAPIINAVKIPFLARLGQRKSWMILSLLGSAVSLLGVGSVNPAAHPEVFSLCLALTALFSGAIYITGISYEIESLDLKEYAEGSASVNTGYRVGLLAAGAFALFLAEAIGWQISYYLLSLLTLSAVIVIALLKEPFRSESALKEWRESVGEKKFLSLYLESFKKPIQEFFTRPASVLILGFVLFYKMGENLSEGMLGPFYTEMGFSKIEIAESVKIIGMVASLAGACFGGLLIKKLGLLRALFFAGLFHSLSYLALSFLAVEGRALMLLYGISTYKYFTSGLAITAFITALWKICNPAFAATQYALFWSILSFKKNIMISSGAIFAVWFSWPEFFIFVFITSIASFFLSLYSFWCLRIDEIKKTGDLHG